MGALIAYVRAVDFINGWIGKLVAWLTLGTVLVCFANVYMRYALGFGYVWMQELYVWMHAIVFLVGAGFTLMVGGHVKVDIFYSKLSPKKKAALDIFGTVVLMMPFLAVVFFQALPFVQFSYSVSEASYQPGGLGMVYLIKGMILVFAVLVALQGLGIIARSLLVLGGRSEYAPQGGGH